MTYYKLWNSLMAKLSESDAKTVRDAVVEKFFMKLLWLPAVSSRERVWDTRAKNYTAKFIRYPTPRPAHVTLLPRPKIAINLAAGGRAKDVKVGARQDARDA